MFRMNTQYNHYIFPIDPYLEQLAFESEDNSPNPLPIVSPEEKGPPEKIKESFCIDCTKNLSREARPKIAHLQPPHVKDPKNLAYRCFLCYSAHITKLISFFGIECKNCSQKETYFWHGTTKKNLPRDFFHHLETAIDKKDDLTLFFEKIKEKEYICEACYARTKKNNIRDAKNAIFNPLVNGPLPKKTTAQNLNLPRKVMEISQNPSPLLSAPAISDGKSNPIAHKTVTPFEDLTCDEDEWLQPLLSSLKETNEELFFQNLQFSTEQPFSILNKNLAMVPCNQKTPLLIDNPNEFKPFQNVQQDMTPHAFSSNIQMPSSEVTPSNINPSFSIPSKKVKTCNDCQKDISHKKDIRIDYAKSIDIKDPKSLIYRCLRCYSLHIRNLISSFGIDCKSCSARTTSAWYSLEKPNLPSRFFSDLDVAILQKKDLTYYRTEIQRKKYICEKCYRGLNKKK